MTWIVLVLVLLVLSAEGSTLDVTFDQFTNLTQVIDNLSKGDDVFINIETDRLPLDEVLLFNNFNSTTLQGEADGSNIICTARNAGLVFRNIDVVQLKDLKMSGCAAILLYSMNITFSSAIHILQCSHVSISRLTIEDSQGSALLLAFVKKGTNVSDSNFTNNRLARSDTPEDVLGGGGIYLYISQSTPDSIFLFYNCTFKNNIAKNTREYSYIFTDPSGKPISGRGRGGGMFVNIRNTVYNNSVILSRCLFVENSAYIGAGLSAEIEYDDSMANKILVEHSSFLHNGCNNDVSGITAGGGGVQVSYNWINFTSTTNNKIKFYNVTFKNNCALLGGGTYFFSGRNTNPNANNELVFDNCTWLQNSAFAGSAVDITPNTFERSNSEHTTVPTFVDCIFIKNSISYLNTSEKSKQEELGTGTLYSSLYNIKFESSVSFYDNIGSAFHIVDATADFIKSNAVFHNNYAIQGGAVSLIGSSSMFIGPNNYSFINNTASDKGGAIYSLLVDSHSFLVSRSCFLQYTEDGTIYNLPSTQWKARVYFTGNFAQSGHGNDIYSTSLLPCQVVASRILNDGLDYSLLKLKDIFQPPGVIFEGESVGFKISTDGAQFSNSTALVKIIPGEEYKLDLQVFDDLDQNIQSTLVASIPSNDDKIMVENTSSCLTNQIITLHGTPGKNSTLLLQATSSRRISTSLEVALENCPPGFALINSVCVCAAISYVGIVRCDTQNFYSLLRVGFWAGYVHTSEGVKLATSICPLNFCKYSKISGLEASLPRSATDLNRAVCGEERSGVLCGQCNPGYVVHFHSPNYDCRKETSQHCKFGLLFYILSEIVPATILFILILVFNVSFTSGALNGFILFSQLLDSLLIDANGIISFPSEVDYLTQIYRVIYGFFNLDFFYIQSLSFCIWKEATVLNIIALKYVTIAYAILLITIVLVFMKHCATRCVGKYCRVSVVRNSIVEGLSAFLVMCYAQCVRVSFTLLTFSTLELSSNEKNITIPKRVWYNGDTVFLGRDHLVYVFPALFVLLTIGLIPPVILIIYPTLFRVLAYLNIQNSCIGKCLLLFSKIKPFLDAFQGSFKDNFRFFAGLYFLYRWIGVLVYANVSSYSIFYTITESILIFMLVLHAICQPYLLKRHNILDSLLIANLALINGLTAIHYYSSRIDNNGIYQENINKSSILQLILIYLPIAYITGYVTVKIVRKCCWKKMTKKSRHLNDLTSSFNNVLSLARESNKTQTSQPEDNDLPYRLLSVSSSCTSSIVSIHNDKVAD